MITVRLCEELYADVTLHSPVFTEYEDGQYEENFSPECASFINKAMHHSRMFRRGRARWHEVTVTPEELSAVIYELVTVWIDDYEDRADYSYDPEERRQYRAYVRKCRKFIAEHERKDKE